LAEFCHYLYSYATHIIEVGLTGRFHMSKIDRKKFCVLTVAEDERNNVG
jgi:hypothetical protein